MDSRLLLMQQLFASAVAAAQPGALLRPHLPAPPRGRTRVLGLGKAAAAMGLAVEAAWPPHAPLDGLLVGPGSAPAGLRRLRWLQAAHPVPDAGSQAAARALLEAARGLGPDDLVIALVSGGASSLACAPIEGLSLADKQALTRALLASGAGIHEMNTVRKHLSALKGGHLAAACGGVPLLSLVVSDVPGDALDVVGSGPTLPDPSRVEDALAVLARYRIPAPAALGETPKPGDPLFAHHRAVLVASPRLALQAAAREAERLGWSCHLLADALEGEARVTGALLAQLALGAGLEGSPFRPPCLLLSGGETTVTLRHAEPGQGGRNAETLLACELALAGAPHISALMADTDGIDGAGPGAGALVPGRPASGPPVSALRARPPRRRWPLRAPWPGAGHRRHRHQCQRLPAAADRSAGLTR